MKTLQLINFNGLPTYFKVEKLPNGERIINYANTNIRVIGDRLLIATDEFEIIEIKEQRPCVLDYGQGEADLFFQSAICKVIYLSNKK